MAQGSQIKSADLGLTTTAGDSRSLEEMSLCHATSHRDERNAEMVMTDPHDPEFPESEMDRHNFERVM